MALMDFIKKQFIDVIQWTEEGDGTLAWRFPMAGMEIQNGGQLVVRESQMAVFVNEGKVADVFGPGTYKLTTQTLPVLTYLKNWDKLFESPFKSDVYFFSTRQQIDQKWGTPQPITIRDKDFGAVRLRAFGNYAFRIADPKLFHTEISGTREELHRGRPGRPVARPGAAKHQQRHCGQRHPVPGPGGQPDRVCQGLAQGAGARDGQARPAARRHDGAKRLAARRAAKDPGPEDRHGHGRQRHGQVHAVPDRAGHSQICRGRAAAAALPATPWAWAPAWRWARCWRKTCRPVCRATPGRRHRLRLPRWACKPDDVMATLEKLGDFKAKGILTRKSSTPRRPSC
jgi:hypothetical protein